MQRVRHLSLEGPKSCVGGGTAADRAQRWTAATMSATVLSPRDPNLGPQPGQPQKQSMDAAGGKRLSLPAKAPMPKELRVEVKQLTEVLGTKDTDWTSRIAALKRIAAMARDEYQDAACGSGSNGPAYLTGFLALCNPIIVQLGELRSAIISEVRHRSHIIGHHRSLRTPEARAAWDQDRHFSCRCVHRLSTLWPPWPNRSVRALTSSATS